VHREDRAAGVLRGEGGAWPGLGWTARQRGVPSHGGVGASSRVGQGCSGQQLLPATGSGGRRPSTVRAKEGGRAAAWHWTRDVSPWCHSLKEGGMRMTGNREKNDHPWSHRKVHRRKENKEKTVKRPQIGESEYTTM